MVQFETTSFSFFWIRDILLTLLFCQRQQFFGAFSGSFGDVFAAQKSCDFIYVSFSFVNIIGNSMIKENWKRGDISAKNAGISPLYFLCIMWWRDWHPTKSAHQSVQTTISAHQILSHHLVQIPEVIEVLLVAFPQSGNLSAVWTNIWIEPLYAEQQVRWRERGCLSAPFDWSFIDICETRIPFHYSSFAAWQDPLAENVQYSDIKPA